MRSINKIASILITIMLIGSLLLPWISEDDHFLPGFFFILMGWIYIFSGIFLWLMFPFIITAIFSLQKSKYGKALIFSTISTLIGFHTISYQGSLVNMIDSEVPFGTLQIGFYIWLISIVTFAILCLVNYIKSNITQPLE